MPTPVLPGPPPTTPAQPPVPSTYQPPGSFSAQSPDSSPELSIPRPPATQSGSPLNAAKFGLLPKRPVSLLRPDSTQTQRKDEDEDEEEDELDYVENPFEEGGK